MARKFLSLDDGLYSYLARFRSDARDPLLKQLRRETLRMGPVSACQISDEQGTFLSILVGAIGARSAIEVGTFTGYSSICIARALPPGGRLLCIDASEDWTRVARKYWARAGLQDRIELRLGDAVQLLAKLGRRELFDFAFVDAEKTQYDAYYEGLLPHIRPNGLILFDNMLWGGRLTGKRVSAPAGRAVHALNRKLATDPRVESVLLSVADGIQLCRKKPVRVR